MPLSIFQIEFSWEKIRIGILDTVFPLYCLGCDKKGQWLCTSCRSDIPRRIHQSCPLCLKHFTPYGQACFECQDKNDSLLDGIFAASYYKSPLLKYVIHSFKYRFLSELSFPLGELLIEGLRKSDIALPEIIIPVPLHKRRLRYRGFNQSALLADHISQTLIPALTLPLVNDLLIRHRYTTPQMKTESKEERIKNLKNAFEIDASGRNVLKGKDVWLIDDVATTGTTLEECASVLKRNGAKSVFGIVLAR